MLKIDRLTESNTRKDSEIASLKAELEKFKSAACGGVAKPAETRLFGSSTPSSLIPIKSNSTEENRARIGGRAKNHPGSGRRKARAEDVDETVEVDSPESCPKCGHRLEKEMLRTRDVIHAVRAHCVTRRHLIHRGYCPVCGKFHEKRITGVLPRLMFTNEFIAQYLVDRFEHCIPQGTLAARAGIKKSALFGMEHFMADMFKPAMQTLLDDFRAAENKHADETRWSCDGKNGYVYAFFSPNTTLFRFRETRAASVPAEVFGDGPHTGVLGVDRYSAYPSVWKGKMQYCLEHYKRNVRDLIEKEPDNKEYARYIPPFLNLLKEAMTLRNRKRGKEYDDESMQIRDRLLKLCGTEIKDGKLKGYFDYMLGNRERFFQWVCHPEIEAENNIAERGVRPLVISRKVSFGSQSQRGLETREVLMSTIRTLKQRVEDPVGRIKDVLDARAKDPDSDIVKLLFGEARSQP